MEIRSSIHIQRIYLACGFKLIYIYLYIYTMSKALVPPPLYGMIEEDVHRSGIPTVPNFTFLERLKLKTVLLLSSEMLSVQLDTFLADEGIEVIIISEDKGGGLEDAVIESLLLVLDPSKHPILLIDSSSHRTGVIVGCLRKAQNWALTSIFEEYRRYAAADSTKRNENEQFIELFDTDLLRLPSLQSELPSWFRSI
jgi:tyrosine-protein phosphatase OCA1